MTLLANTTPATTVRAMPRKTSGIRGSEDDPRSRMTMFAPRSRPDGPCQAIRPATCADARDHHERPHVDHRHAVVGRTRHISARPVRLHHDSRRPAPDWYAPDHGPG